MTLTGGILFYVAGLALAPYLDDHFLYRVVPFLLAGPVILLKGRAIRPWALAIFLVSFGLNQYFVTTSVDPTDRTILNSVRSGKIVVEGRVKSISSRPDNAISIDLASVQVRVDDQILRFSDRVRIFSKDHDQPLRPGMTIRFLTNLKEPENFRSPGAFDFRRYLNRRHLVASGFIEKSSHVAILDRDGSRNPAERIGAWRERIRELINGSVPQNAAPLVNALAIGDRGSLSTETRKLLAESGLAHLFAISGLHLGLVASLLYLFFRPLYLRTLGVRLGWPARRVLPPILLPLLFAYMILTGSALSALRAFLMVFAAVVLISVSRRSRPLDILTSVAFIILLFDPLALFEPSFQLSVAGAGGILFFMPLWLPKLSSRPRLVRYPLSLLAISASASLTTAPFVLMHFHILAPASLPLNLLAVPLVAFVLVPLSLAGLCSALFSSSMAIYFFKSVALLLMPMLNLAEKVVALDLLSAKRLFLAPTGLALIGLSIVFVACLISLRNGKRTLICLALGLAIGILGMTGYNNDGLEVIAVDVGQGEATLLRMPDGSNYLIDGGGLYSEHFDTGERLIAPALGRLGIDRLTAVVLSHDHPDHSKGLDYILRYFPVDAFWSPYNEAELHPDLLTILTSNDIPARKFIPGWQDIDERHKNIRVFVPDQTSSNENDRSLVLYARQGNDGILMTGDLETRGIAQLIRHPAPGPVTLLKLPHHGSLKSDPASLLRFFEPAFVFASVGRNNRYHLPHESVLDTIEEAAVPLLRTDIDGTFRLTSDGRGWAITRWKKGLFR